MQVHVKCFEKLSSRDIYEIGKLRSEVFVVEQNCAYLDLDGKDYHCIHFFTQEKGEITSYLRVLPPGLSYDSPSIGRVVVKPTYRGKNLARENISSAIEYIFLVMKYDTITIGAQKYLEKFYESFGFKRISDDYDEDGIMHLDMQLKSGEQSFEL